MNPPSYYVDKAIAFEANEQWAEASEQWRKAATASAGHKRRANYRERAMLDEVKALEELS